MQMNTKAICAICVAILVTGCVGEDSSRTYTGQQLDVGYMDGRYEEYNNVIDVKKTHTEPFHYTRKITFSDGSCQTHPSVVDEVVVEGRLYYSMTLTFADGSVKHLDHVTGYETVETQQPYLNIVLTFADGSKTALHYVTSYQSI
jgi:hypothetical protein